MSQQWNRLRDCGQAPTEEQPSCDKLASMSPPARPEANVVLSAYFLVALINLVTIVGLSSFDECGVSCRDP